jgi:protein TonB
MRQPSFRPFASLSFSRHSLFQRIRENFQQAFAPARIFPSSANGAPLHVLAWQRHSAGNRSRTISFVGHALLVFGLLFLHGQLGPPKGHGEGPETPLTGGFTFFPVPDRSQKGEPSLGLHSGGGERDPRPARHGDLAPASSRPLLPPRQSVNPAPELPVPAAVFDPNASQTPSLITNLGLPWMKDDSDSAGPGKDHGFGSGKKGGMGDDIGPGAGRGDSYKGPYADVVKLPTCAYCPDPQYTDEAREAKMQGRVTLRVLVGADGRAEQIQIIQGIGMGLDDRAVQSVRVWRFVPAHDAARRAVPVWVTIEVVFRLI